MKIEFISKDFELGDFGIAPFVRLTDGEDFLSYECIKTDNHLHLSAKNDRYTDDLYVKKTEGGFAVRRSFYNLSDAPLELIELGVRFYGISLGGDSKADFYYHAENPRLFDKMALKVDSKRTSEPTADSEYDEVAGNKWCDPGVVVDRIGTCPYQPFPAILFANPASKRGIVHGTLSQDVFYHCYLPTHTGGLLDFDAYSAFKDVEYRIVDKKETLVDIWYLGYTDHADDIERIFDGYSSELRKMLPANYGATRINRDNLIWGTWNDGIGSEISEDLVLRESEAMMQYFPKVRWIQLDAGYCAFQSSVGFTLHGLGVPYEGEEGVDKIKFPNGLRHLSDKIREKGLRPAIWIGGCCPKDTRISRERPDLMSAYQFREGRYDILDLSNPDAREYMTSALDTMIYSWGFEGVKHDFWSYAFEVSEPVLKNNAKSGYEYRDWWCQEVRKRLPGDAYFQSCCDIAMSNPFLGKYFTNYRYGIDIGAGKWNNVKTNYRWCIACLATHTGDLFVPNSDAIGMFPGLSDTDAEFTTNFLIITRTMVELAGKYSKIDRSSPRFKMVRKATCHINNGQDVYFDNYDYRKNDTVPEIIYLKTPHFSNETKDFAPVRTVAVFNISDDDRQKRVITRSGLCLPEGEYILTDVWTGERISLSEKVELTLDAHGSRLFSVNKADTALLLDSNVELENMSLSAGVFAAELNYPYDCELTLTARPVSVLVCDESVPFEWNGVTVKFSAKCKGRLTIKLKNNL